MLFNLQLRTFDFGVVFSPILIYSFREDFLVKSAKKTVKIFTNK